MLQKLETHDLTDRELQESYWIVTHWKMIERAIVRVLVVFNAVLILFTFGFLVKLFVIDNASTKTFIESVRAMAQGPVLSQSVEPISALSTTVLPSKGGRADISVKVGNPNKTFRAYFDLVFLANGQEIKRVASFLYPGETKYVLGLSVPYTGSPNDISAQPVNVLWYRMTPADDRLISDLRAFRVEDFSFASAEEVSKATFSITNTGVGNFWNVRIPVVLLSGESVAAANQISLDHLDSGQKKPVSVSWYEVVPQPSSFDISPELDVFDNSTYRTKKSPLQRLR